MGSETLAEIIPFCHRVSAFRLEKQLERIGVPFRVVSARIETGVTPNCMVVVVNPLIQPSTLTEAELNTLLSGIRLITYNSRPYRVRLEEVLLADGAKRSKPGPDYVYIRFQIAD